MQTTTTVDLLDRWQDLTGKGVSIFKKKDPCPHMHCHYWHCCHHDWHHCNMCPQLPIPPMYKPEQEMKPEPPHCDNMCPCEDPMNKPCFDPQHCPIHHHFDPHHCPDPHHDPCHDMHHPHHHPHLPIKPMDIDGDGWTEDIILFGKGQNTQVVNEEMNNIESVTASVEQEPITEVFAAPEMENVWANDNVVNVVLENPEFEEVPAVEEVPVVEQPKKVNRGGRRRIQR